MEIAFCKASYSLRRISGQLVDSCASSESVMHDDVQRPSVVGGSHLPPGIISRLVLFYGQNA